MNQPAANQPLPAPAIWGETNKGRQRDYNEDQVYPDTRHKTSMRPPTPQAVQTRGYLLVVADGIGGAQVGDTAANFAVRSVVDHYYNDPRPLSLDRLLQSAVEIANTSVHNYVRNSPAIQQAGCTLTAAAIRGNELVVAHVGDSRAYLLQDGAIYPITTDHNVAQMKASGQPLPGGGQGLAGNMLVRSLGAGPVVEVDVKRFSLKPGDTVLVCSDGLHSVVNNEEIRQIAGRETPAKGARKLIDLANARGGPDNISVAIARVPGAVAAPAGATSSNRITALAIATLALLAVLALVLFALVRQDGSGGVPATTTTVALTSSGTSTSTPEAARETPTPGAGSATVQATGADLGGTPTATALPTTTRAATSTPNATDTPTARPTIPPAPTRLTGVPTAVTTTQPPGPGPAPSLVRPEDGSELRGTVLLGWFPNSLLQTGQRYRVTLRTEQNQPQKELPLPPTTDQTILVRFDGYPDFFKDDNTEYFWSVVVINPSGAPASQPSREGRFVYRSAGVPSSTPGVPPTSTPTVKPPTLTPTAKPPTSTPTKLPPPTPTPTTEPTSTPTTEPTSTPTTEPTSTPTTEPTSTPTTEPTTDPTTTS